MASGMEPAAVSIRRANIRRALIVCATTVALSASGSFAAAAARPLDPSSSGPRGLRASVREQPVDGPNFSGIYLSAWGTSHVAFGDAFKAWLDQAGAIVTAQAPFTLDAGGGGFTMPASPATSDRLDVWGRMAYSGALMISLPERTHEAAAQAQRRTLAFGPMFIRVVPDVSWSATLSVNGSPAAGEVELATADYPEVLAGGGTPSPSGFRADRLPFHLSQDAADLLASAGGRTAPAAGSLFGTLTPSFDHVPTAG